MNKKQHHVKNGKYRTPNGDIFWYKDGLIHKDSEPAIIHVDGDTRWYINGKKHREDGPAIERGKISKSNRANRWFLEDIEYTEEEFNIFLEKKKLNESLNIVLSYKPIRFKTKI